jgi:hypothetical protein
MCCKFETKQPCARGANERTPGKAGSNEVVCDARMLVFDDQFAIAMIFGASKRSAIPFPKAWADVARTGTGAYLSVGIYRSI